MRLFGTRLTALRSVAVNQNCLLFGRQASVPLRLPTWPIRVHAPPSSMFKRQRFHRAAGRHKPSSPISVGDPCLAWASYPPGAACPAAESLEPCRVVVADVLAPPRSATKSLRSVPSGEVGSRRRRGGGLGSAVAHAGAQPVGSVPQLSTPSARRGVSFRPRAAGLALWWSRRPARSGSSRQRARHTEPASKPMPAGSFDGVPPGAPRGLVP